MHGTAYLNFNIKLGSDEDVMPKLENALACRCGELMGRKPLRFDDYFIALVFGAVEESTD